MDSGVGCLTTKLVKLLSITPPGGVMAIGGLALASKYYSRPDYLKIAEDAAHFYYQRGFMLGRVKQQGGCADILQNADWRLQLAS